MKACKSHLLSLLYYNLLKYDLIEKAAYSKYLLLLVYTNKNIKRILCISNSLNGLAPILGYLD